mmetsp:Transcript_8632/g.20777  ORF Transcript_8632/g.20777 Transcript_8632/m.20777 type:complete len:216 (+) Transcript_8632:179-826(+)
MAQGTEGPPGPSPGHRGPRRAAAGGRRRQASAAPLRGHPADEAEVESACPAPSCPPRGHARPEALVELVAEGAPRRAGLDGGGEVPHGREDVAVPRLGEGLDEAPVHALRRQRPALWCLSENTAVIGPNHRYAPSEQLHSLSFCSRLAFLLFFFTFILSLFVDANAPSLGLCVQASDCPSQRETLSPRERGSLSERCSPYLHYRTPVDLECPTIS